MLDFMLATAGDGLGIGLIVLLVVASLIAFAFWLWMLIDAIRNPHLETGMKIIWVIIIVVLELIGALIYYFVARSAKLGGTAPG